METDLIFDPAHASAHEKFSLMMFERLEATANTIDALHTKIHSMAEEMNRLKEQVLRRDLDMKLTIMQRYLELGMTDFPHIYSQEDCRLSAWFTLAYNIQTAGYKLPERIQILECPLYNITFGELTDEEKNQVEELCRPFRDLCVKWSKQQDYIEFPLDFVEKELVKLATLLVLLPIDTIIGGDFDPWCARWINRIE